MAENANKSSYEVLMAAIRAKRLSPLYLLMGDEPYYIDLLTNYMIEHLLTPEERDFNMDVIFGADHSAAKIADMARAYPLMAPYRVIIVKEAQNLKDLEALCHYAENPSKTTILVLCHKNGSMDKRKKIYGRIEKNGVIFESKQKKSYELPQFIESYVASKNATIEKKAVAIIADHVGTDLCRLTSEIDKVLIALPDNQRVITPQLVEDRIGVSKTFNNFELQNAIIEKDIYKANQIINYFEKNPKAGSLYAIMPMLINFFQNLMTAYYAPNKTNEKALADFLELKSFWGVKDYIVALKNYSAAKTLNIIHKLREIDAKSKGLDNPNTPSEELMRELIFFILH